MNILAGGECKFTCQIKAQPAADIEWFKFNERLAPSKKYKFDCDGYTQTLTIRNIEYADEGNYYCAARNQFGREEISAKLTVESEPKFDQTYKFKENLEFTGGLAVHYEPSSIVGTAAHQHLATGQIIGKRFHSQIHTQSFCHGHHTQGFGRCFDGRM